MEVTQISIKRHLSKYPNVETFCGNKQSIDQWNSGTLEKHFVFMRLRLTRKLQFFIDLISSS